MLTKEAYFILELMLDCGIYQSMIDNGGRYTPVEKENFRKDINSRLDDLKSRNPSYDGKLVKLSNETVHDLTKTLGEIFHSIP
ncbi:MAG TPA: hypothetical protein VMC80_01885 [Patescibacteria group bacterium]|nr:hypothetical protein [Patescibacteria group bacterium]